MTQQDPVEAMKQQMEFLSDKRVKEPTRLISVDKTILRGWPFKGVDNWPTQEEAYDIESIHHELMIQNPDISEADAWFTGGQLVARMRRDRLDRENRPWVSME